MKKTLLILAPLLLIGAGCHDLQINQHDIDVAQHCVDAEGTPYVTYEGSTNTNKVAPPGFGAVVCESE